MRSPVPVLATGLLFALGGCTPPPDAAPAPDGVPSASSPVALAPDGRTLWVVNPDADSVTALDLRTLVAANPIPVGREPWAVAVAPTGAAIVMNRADGNLTLVEGGRTRHLPVGAEPGGLALAPSGRMAYVTLSSADAVAVVDMQRFEVVERRAVGRLPWAIAVTDEGDLDDDDEILVVAHRRARLRPGGAEATDDGKEGWLTILPAAGGIAREVALEPDAFGYPNGLEGLAIHDDQVFVVHQSNRPELPRDFEHTVTGALARVPLLGTADAPLRQDLNDDAFATPTNGPTAVALAPDGRRAYVVLAGSDLVMGIDLVDPAGPALLGFWPTGANPRGIVVAADGAHAYVSNFLSRDVSVLDLTDVAARREVARVAVAPETLDPTVVRGKVLFHLAADPRISQLGWIACASCHQSGGADGTTWLTPDGPRQTQPLWRLRGTAPLHASATRDEVQDFELDIEDLMAGHGLAPGAAAPALGEPNGGRSVDLDALATYVLDGIRVPRAARHEDVVAGRALFASLGCTACHAGPAWTVSALPGPVGSLGLAGEVEVRSVLRDVGTFDASRDVLGANGFDVPTLLGLHATAPYLHDGSAATLVDVLANVTHAGRALSDDEVAAVVAFLATIDARTAPF